MNRPRVIQEYGEWRRTALKAEQSICCNSSPNDSFVPVVTPIFGIETTKKLVSGFLNFMATFPVNGIFSWLNRSRGTRMNDSFDTPTRSTRDMIVLTQDGR